jgi:hypothetical protein
MRPAGRRGASLRVPILTCALGRPAAKALTLLGCLSPAFAEAAELPFHDSEVTGSFDTSITLGAAFRVQHRDEDLIGVVNGGDANSINGDDGNLNFDQGESYVAQRHSDP